MGLTKFYTGQHRRQLMPNANVGAGASANEWPADGEVQLHLNTGLI